MPNSSRPDLTKIHHTAAYRAVTRAWDEPVALACSGGVDSTALLLLATAARDRGHLPEFVVTHVDHRSRTNSADDAEHIADLCTALSAPFQSLSIESESAPAGSSIEAWWREQRYLAIHRVVMANQLAGVATAHTLDDQVESILMRLLTGMGGSTAGMIHDSQVTTAGGMLRVYRPLLDISRSELKQVLVTAGVEPLIDPSNIDTRYLRNRVRHELVPMLDKHFPGFRAPLLRAAELAGRDGHFADSIALAAYSELVHVEDNVAAIDREGLAGQPPAIGSRIVRHAIEDVTGEFDRELSFDRIEAVRLAAAGRTGAIIQLPGGITAKVTRREIVISRGNRGEDV